jgi:hypothetical protein
MLSSNDPGGDPELIASQFESVAQARIALLSLLTAMLGLPAEVASKIPAWHPWESGT